MSEYQSNQALADAAMARDLAKLRAPKVYPQTIASRLAPRPSFFARLFGAR